jgi:hypoxanthine phosphoribosyltransferase
MTRGISKPRPQSSPLAQTSSVPRRWRRDIARVLFTGPRIAVQVRRLAREIQRDSVGDGLVIVALLNGTILFLADLLRYLTLPVELDFLGVSSYRTQTEAGELVYTKEIRLDLRNRDVLVVDDILDTGRTLKSVLSRLRTAKPRSLRVCVLLEKTARRREKVHADYVGFQIPDLFVVGYGLDYAERYRNLPFIGVLQPDILVGKTETSTRVSRSPNKRRVVCSERA